MTDETQLANSIADLYLQREEAMADRRRLEQELGAALSTIEGMRRALEVGRADVLAAWEQSGSDRADLNAALNELDAARALGVAAANDLNNARYERDQLELWLSTTECERDEALADAASLHQSLDAACGLVKGLLYDDGTDAAIKRAEREVYYLAERLAQPHPGAAILAELNALRLLAQELRAVAGAPGEDIRATIDDWLKGQDHAK